MAKKYVVHYGDGMINSFESNSRNAKQHLIGLGGDEVLVTNHSGKRISGAKRDADGTVYSCYIPD